MPAVARHGDAVDTVHGAIGGDKCNDSKTSTTTDTASPNVFAENKAVVREDDTVTAHNDGIACVTHTPKLNKFSGNVFANGKKIGRVDDTYECGAKITKGASKVFAN